MKQIIRLLLHSLPADNLMETIVRLVDRPDKCYLVEPEGIDDEMYSSVFSALANHSDVTDLYQSWYKLFMKKENYPMKCHIYRLKII